VRLDRPRRRILRELATGSLLGFTAGGGALVLDGDRPQFAVRVRKARKLASAAGLVTQVKSAGRRTAYRITEAGRLAIAGPIARREARS
jgi:hypothetical protein